MVARIFPTIAIWYALKKKFICAMLLFIPLFSDGQTEALISKYEEIEDVKESNKVITEIVEKCDFNVSCTKPLKALIFGHPTTDKKISNAFQYASIWANKGYYSVGQTYFQAGILMTTKMKADHPMLGRFYNSIASSYAFENKLDSAMMYADLAMQHFRQHDMTKYYWMPYHTKYLVYLSLKDFERADENLIKAYDFVDPANRMDKGFLLHTLIMAKKNRGPKVDFEKYIYEYIKFKKAGKSTQPFDAEHIGLMSFFDTKEEAIKVLEERLKQLEKVKEVDPSTTRMVLAENYTIINEHANAIALLKQAKSEPSATNNKSLHWQMYETYKKAGMHQDAYTSLESYIQILDSTYNQILENNIAEGEVKFKTHEQQQEIEIRDVKLKNATFIRNVIIALFLIAACLGLLLFYLFKKKKQYQTLLMEKEITIQQQQIKDLNQKNKLLSLSSMIEGQEAERLRIAQDLHDGLGGLLTTVKAHFNAIQKEIDQISALNMYAKTNHLIDEACGEVRRIAHNMVPYSLTISGLTGALEDLKLSLGEKGLVCELEIFNFDETKLTDDKKIMLYRIFQELTTNAVKHAEASHLMMQIFSHESELHLMVEDNGKGMDLKELSTNKGMGIKSIESRVNFLGGTINYDATIGKGTTVNLVIPT